MHDGAGCGYGCGPGVDTAALDALGGGWARLEGACRAVRGPERVQERQADRENEAKKARVRGLMAAAHFIDCPAAAQWAMAGEAPAPQLNDRSRPWGRQDFREILFEIR